MSSRASAVAAARRAQEDVQERSTSAGGEGGKEAPGLVLAGVEVPEPVFFCSIEPPSMAKQAGESVPLPKRRS